MAAPKVHIQLTPKRVLIKGLFSSSHVTDIMISEKPFVLNSSKDATLSRHRSSRFLQSPYPRAAPSPFPVCLVSSIFLSTAADGEPFPFPSSSLMRSEST